MDQTVKRLPTMWETQVQPLGWEDLLKKEMATHSSILGWKIPWMEEAGWLQSVGSQRVENDWGTSLSFLSVCWPCCQGQMCGGVSLSGENHHLVGNSTIQVTDMWDVLYNRIQWKRLYSTKGGTSDVSLLPSWQKFFFFNLHFLNPNLSTSALSRQ